MRVRTLLRRGAASVVLMLAPGMLVASGAGAELDCDGADPPPVCDPEPAPQPEPLARRLQLYVAGDNDALPVATAVMSDVLDRVAPANRAVLAGKTITVHVIPDGWKLTDLPLWRDRRGQEVEGDPYDRTYDELIGVARASGGSLDAAAAESTLFVPPDQLSGAAEARLGNVLAHELGHLIMAGLTPEQRTRLAQLRKAARNRFSAGQTADIIGRDGDSTSFEYTTWNDDEFFAEGTVLPAPFGPSSATISPAPTSRSRSRTAGTPS